MADSKWEQCNIIVSNLESLINSHPLYLGISPSHAAHLGISKKQKVFTCCLRWWWANNKFALMSTGRPGEKLNCTSIFVTIKQLSVKHEADKLSGEVGNNIILSATEVFIRHYSLDNLTAVTGFQIRQINCVTLTDVVFHAQTRETYDWVTKSPEWKTNLLITSCQQPLLCRRNDVCLTPLSKKMVNSLKEIATLFDLCTLNCQPVHQGVIGPNTSISILEPNCQKFESDDMHLENGECFSSGFDNNYLSAIFKLIVTADFALTLLTPFFFRVHDMKTIKKVIKQVAVVNKVGTQWKTKLKVQLLTKPPFRENELNVDLSNTVFVTTAWLTQYKLQDLCWVKVWVNSCSTSKKRLVRMFSVDISQEEIDFSVFGRLNDNTAYITPQLWFNLNDHPSTLVQPDALLFLQPMVMDSLPGPSYAQEIHISLIQSTTLSLSAQIDKLLKRYFKIPRLVYKGDVICLAVNGDEEDDIGVAYYSVTKLNPDNDYCLVDHHKSSLYQGAAVSSYVPKTMDVYFSLEQIHPIWNSPIPFGLDKYSSQICDVIQPYLNSARLRANGLTSLCLRGPSACGKTTVINAVAKMFNLNTSFADCWEIIGESAAASEARLKIAIQKALLRAPCIFILKNVHVMLNDFDGIANDSVMVHKFREILLEFKDLAQPIIVVGLTNNVNIINSELGNIFLHNIKMEVPNKIERFKMLSVLLDGINYGLDISLNYLVKNTSGYVLGDLIGLTNRAIQSAYQRLSRLSNDEDICLSGIQLLTCDFDEAFVVTQAAQSDAMGAPQIPQVKWEDVGGLEDIKLELLNSVKLPLENPDLLATGMRRSGVMLYGPPGTGKTLLAKAVATEFSLNFISVKGPELLSMYVGQSEENVRKVFQRARDASPVIVFFDEMDSLAPNRGRSGDSGGVMDRVVSQLLAEIDGLSKYADVFVMAATNRPDLIDPALLRPGRFDKLLYVGISEDRSSQLKILKALTRKFSLGEDVDLNAVVQQCSGCFTGADFYALCSDAFLSAVARKVEGLIKDESDDGDLVVEQRDFVSAVDSLVPSVSPQLLQSYASLATRMRR